MDLDSVEQNPKKVSLEEIPIVIGRLEALKTQLNARLFRFEANSPGQDSQKPSNGDDRWLTADEVANILQTDKRSVYRMAPNWSFTRRLSQRKLRFSETGLRRWMQTRGRPSAAA